MNRANSAVAIAVALTLLTSQSALGAGKTSVTLKKAGRAATFTPNTILSGNVVPSKTLGQNGDFYIDIKIIALHFCSIVRMSFLCIQIFKQPINQIS